MHLDRLSALIRRFSLYVSVNGEGEGNLRVFGTADESPFRATLSPTGARVDERAREHLLIAASVDWGGSANPLFASLHDTLEIEATDSETAGLLHLFLAEARGGRCGSASALGRLAEVLVIRMLRAQIEKGSTEPGLIAGLADPRLSRAIVAMHDEPGRTLGNDELAALAGMSVSRFNDVFRERVGLTPQTYLRRWRMTLARQDIAGGDRIQTVARRYGYGSAEALNRAFNRQYGSSPSSVRTQAGIV